MENRTKPQSINILMCEDIREEVRSKLSLMGLFTGNAIEFAAPIEEEKGKPVGMTQLAFLVIFQGGNGKYSVKFEIAGPESDTTVAEHFTPPRNVDIELKENKTANLVIQVAPFVVHKFGEYKIRILLDGQQAYLHSFRVTRIGEEDERVMTKPTRASNKKKPSKGVGVAGKSSKK